MNAVNLLPPARVAQWRLRRRIGRWSVSLAVYSVVILCVASMVAPAVSEAARETEQKIQLAEAEIERADLAFRKVRPDLARVLDEVQDARAISEHPDWSLLLALAGALKKDDILLESCDLTSPPPLTPAIVGKQSKPEKVAAPEPPVLGLSGCSLTPAGVTQFALRLESSGLFSAVQIVETSPRELQGKVTTGFRIRCILDTPVNAEPEKPGRVGGKK